MTYPVITHHGAIVGVTGSCHQLHLNAVSSLLIDCGLFQGVGTGRSPGPAIDFPISGIEALLVTHIHLDHVGRIPGLLAAGFKGPIICSQPSARLLPLVLEDALRLGVAQEKATIERYVKLVERQVVAVPYDQWYEVVGTDELTCRIRLQRAGHVLGSAYVECDIHYLPESTHKRVVFSGDLGASHTPLLRPPVSPERADILVLESTYGDRLHDERSNRQQRLERMIDQALADHGTVLIPAFSAGRTQELLYEIEGILHRKALDTSAPCMGGGLPVDWPQLPVILDSPLASRFTQAYRELNDFWNDEARQRLEEGRRPLRFRQLITIDSHDQHVKTVNYLASTGRPAIVISGSGMCTGGRIVNYLKAMLGDPRHQVLFVGYQAKGTPGAVIQASEGAQGFVMLDLDGEMYEIKARVATLGGYSAHADQSGLVEFVTGIREWPEKVVLVHGERRAKVALAEALRSRYDEEGRALLVEIPG
ncbi:Ribonuclease [compost metagenome]